MTLPPHMAHRIAQLAALGTRKRKQTVTQPQSGDILGDLGVNQPLPYAKFIAYHDHQPIFGGQRLFVLV